MKSNIILEGNSLTKLKELPDESIDCVMTSPPYWALRDYGKEVEAIWGGLTDCPHDFEMKERQLHSGSSSKSWEDDMSRGIRGKADWKATDGFCSKCNAWKGQLGLEPSFDLFISHLCDVFDETKRVLKKTGTCWINLGDTYIGSPAGNSNQNYQEWGEKGDGLFKRLGRRNTNSFDPKNPASLRGREQVPKQKLPNKTLAMIPFRFAIEMVNRGWILRNTIIWHKPNVMPSSVRDRFTVDFEYIFFFVKAKKYFFERQYEPHLSNSIKRMNEGFNQNQAGDITKRDKFKKTGLRANHGGYTNPDAYNPLGKNKRCIWKISTKPFKEAHFAVFPETLCETPIKSGCPEFICNKCGKAREKIYIREKAPPEVFTNTTRPPESMRLTGNKLKNTGQKLMNWRNKHPDKFKEYSDCGCNAGFSGGIVLDPFFGSGTTGLVALKNKRNFIGIELNPEYIKIAEKRLKPYLEQNKLEIPSITTNKQEPHTGES